MGGYLDGYGRQDARRERVVFRVVAVVVALVLTTGAVYFFLLRNRKEKQQVQSFLALLRNKDYRSAYGLWGCTEKTPCREYAFEKFLQDWGTQSPHAEAAAARVAKTRSCSSGIIATVEFASQEPVLLFVGRNDLAIGFAPWPMCNPRLPSSTP